MAASKTDPHYVNLRGVRYAMRDFDPDERGLLTEWQRLAKRSDWTSFHNSWLRSIADFYLARGLSRSDIVDLPLFRIGQDLASRLAIAEGLARAPDYRDDLERLIHVNFSSRREFCNATGLSEDMLSHVLARRKHLAVDTLSAALERIGYTLQIAPLASEPSN